MTARPGNGTTRLFVGTGRSAGVRPQDLVGVITGKSNLSGRDIGAIEIADRFSLVEVPEAAADDVVAALQQASIKGRRAKRAPGTLRGTAVGPVRSKVIRTEVRKAA